MTGKQARVGSRIQKRSIKIGGHGTSISLEDEFWQALGEIALFRNVSIPKLVATIDTEREHANLSSQLRVYVLEHYRRLAEDKAKR
jgi:predicted DNA-binding ribbon-helix-helix protein